MKLLLTLTIFCSVIICNNLIALGSELITVNGNRSTTSKPVIRMSSGSDRIVVNKQQRIDIEFSKDVKLEDDALKALRKSYAYLYNLSNYCCLYSTFNNEYRQHSKKKTRSLANIQKMFLDYPTAFNEISSCLFMDSAQVRDDKDFKILLRSNETCMINNQKDILNVLQVWARYFESNPDFADRVWFYSDSAFGMSYNRNIILDMLFAMKRYQDLFIFMQNNQTIVE
ncbi:MAG: hypothetical protein JJV93_01890 [Alphaproteobacteria bacterium]|nr:hypothetical protein [Alphaproteobacteria bacterium]